MSKSRGNVVNPDEMIDQFGTDAVRLYEMFMGPLESMKPWSTRGVEGITRFLDRVWRLMVGDEGSLSQAVTDAEPAPEQLRLLHYTIKKVTDDIDALRFNTAIAQMMVFTNEMTKLEQRPRRLLEPFVLLLLPFAPHLSEELWAVSYTHLDVYKRQSHTCKKNSPIAWSCSFSQTVIASSLPLPNKGHHAPSHSGV